MLQPGQTASIETAGAGGYGDPADRSAEQVDEDVRRGVIDEATAQDYARRRAGK
jgi:N-methylhydantoinase B